MRRVVFVLVASFTAACGGDDGGVEVVAHVVSGAQGPPTAAAGGGTPADGRWLLSPDVVTVTLTQIGFESPNQGVGVVLDNCVVTFERDAPALSSLLDCPFVAPEGTYTSMTLTASTEFELTISDPVNGFFTDPTAEGGLTSMMPIDGAAPATFTTTNTRYEHTFVQPMVVEVGEPTSLTIVLDALQSFFVTVTGGIPDYTGRAPLYVFSTTDVPGRAQFYSSEGSAASRYEPPSGTLMALRAYDESDGGQPMFVALAEAIGEVSATCLQDVGAAAYSADAVEQRPDGSGLRAGGWLGRDSTGTMCWALGTDQRYTSYGAYLTLPDVTTVGDSALLSCEVTPTPTPPSSGSTYASGCPAVNLTESATLILAAQ